MVKGDLPFHENLFKMVIIFSIANSCQGCITPGEQKAMSRLFTIQSQLLMAWYRTPFDNIMRKRTDAGNQIFLFFPSFQACQREKSSF